MPRTVVTVPVLSDALSKSPLSLAVRAGDFVYVSGIPPVSLETGEFVRGDIRTQTEASMRAVGACLEAAGASFADAVSIRIYCANTAWYSEINDVYTSVFDGSHPTRTFVAVASWPLPFDIEIDCVAYAPQS